MELNAAQDHGEGINSATADVPSEENKKAVQVIQRTYRGHRTRRQLHGFGLDAQTRWYEAVKDAQYQLLTTPHAPALIEESHTQTRSPRSRWKQASKIAAHAGSDDYSVSGDSSDEEMEEDEAIIKIEQQRALATEQRKKTAKMMDLQYFLEMVDQKHRYGSNLRKYHHHWKQQDTTQNFFYWLDQGDGKDVSLEQCSRTRLNKEQVRYLSREERMQYLVKIDEDGKLIWAKNGELVWTKDELYKDSLNGIVPATDPTPKFQYNIKPDQQDVGSSDDESSSEDFEEDGSNNESTKGDEGERYVNEEFHRARGPAKLKHVSAAVLFNHMIRKSLKKGHKWIFVADTSFRLYIGYKQSGAFQHSSFLHGSRILSAGLIKVKDGQLRSLAPLSGHYRPPARNFRAFVHTLRDEGVDMSRVNISKSYAVLVGLEGYTKTRKRVKKAENTISHGIDKVVRPDKVREEEEAAQDKSQSAAREREVLEQQRKALKKDQEAKSQIQRIGTRASEKIQKLTQRGDDVIGFDATRGIGGTGPEDGVPAPEGQR